MCVLQCLSLLITHQQVLMVLTHSDTLLLDSRLQGNVSKLRQHPNKAVATAAAALVTAWSHPQGMVAGAAAAAAAAAAAVAEAAAAAAASAREGSKRAKKQKQQQQVEGVNGMVEVGGRYMRLSGSGNGAAAAAAATPAATTAAAAAESKEQPSGKRKREVSQDAPATVAAKKGKTAAAAAAAAAVPRQSADDVHMCDAGPESSGGAKRPPQQPAVAGPVLSEAAAAAVANGVVRVLVDGRGRTYYFSTATGKSVKRADVDAGKYAGQQQQQPARAQKGAARSAPSGQEQRQEQQQENARQQFVLSDASRLWCLRVQQKPDAAFYAAAAERAHTDAAAIDRDVEVGMLWCGCVGCMCWWHSMTQ